MDSKKKGSKNKNQQNTAEACSSVVGNVHAQITPQAVGVKNSEAEDALNKVIEVLRIHKDGDATLEENLKTEINLIKSEIIRSKIRSDLLFSNKSKFSEMEVNNNNLKLEQQKFIVSINNYKQSINNQVKLLQLAEKKAKESESKIEEFQSKVSELQGENKTLRDELKLIGDKNIELIATGEALTAQMIEMSATVETIYSLRCLL